MKRYIPGNIWSFLSRSVLFGERNVPKHVLISALFTEAQLVLLGALILTAFSLPFSSLLIPQLHAFSWLFPVAYIVAVTLGAIYIFSKHFTQRILKKEKSYFTAVLPQFNPAVNAIQLFLSFISFILFGLGSYLLSCSLVYLPLQHLSGYILFFIFSFFVGYISVITPMGLGVREGVITLGLGSLLPVPSAGMVAIVLRVVFIFSELLAMGIAYVWFSTKNVFIKRVERFITSHKQETALSLSIFFYCSYFTTASFLRFENFFTGRFDLGNMDQTVWNTLHGRIFMFTNPDGTEILSRLAFHADFILILLTPFYALWRDPRMILLLQTVILSFGAVFVYLLAQKILKNKNVSLGFAISYLLYPALGYTNLYDFHAVTFSTTLLLATYYFAREKKYIWFFLFAILSGLCKEEVWFIIALFGLYFFFVQKKRILGIVTFLGFLFLTYYIISILIPQARGNSHFALSYLSDFGDSPLAIIKTLLFSPQKVIAVVLEPSRLNYLQQLLMPLGFISLFAPFLFIFAAPDLLINLLSNNNNLHQIYYQYTASITPFIFIAGIYGAAYLKKRFYLQDKFLITYLLLMSILSAYFYGPLPGAKNPNIDMFTRPQADKSFIADYLRSIPRQYSLATTNNIGAHVTHRRYLFTIPRGTYDADIVAFLLGDRFAQPSPKAQEEMVENFKNDPRYILRVRQGNFYVFEKRLVL